MAEVKSDPRIDVTSPYTPRRPAPILSLSINHPIGALFRKIKNFLTHKQTLFATTFSIKVTPIVAMVSLFGVFAVFGGGITAAFQYGKSVGQKFLLASMTTTPTPTIKQNLPLIAIVSRAGIVQATYQDPPEPNQPTPAPTSNASASATPTVLPSPSPRPVLHYILVGKTGSPIFLQFPQTIQLQKYVGTHVLVTGSFDSSKNTLTIARADDVEVLQ